MKNEEKIIKGLNETIAHAKGKETGGRETIVDPRQVDIREIRKTLGLSQREFAKRFGVALGTLRNWEQRRREPEDPTRLLLHAIRRYPEMMAKVAEEATEEVG